MKLNCGYTHPNNSVLLKSQPHLENYTPIDSLGPVDYYKAKRVGLVMSTIDGHATFQAFDVAHGNRMHRYLQLNPN